IEVLPLKERKEDLEELKNIYIKEANKIYETSKIFKDIEIDLSTNGISLKKSIYKAIALQSTKKEDIEDILYNFFLLELEKEKDYRTLLEIFEVSLLNASKQLYSSQLKMSKKLNINRITLRKKIAQYFER
ncbi:MAG: Fis family transcriptional regulator, partial [Campylobacterota bacterium]|nr:Fis family transcriptional regulator [Campylobacterota bacterium]